MRPLCLAVFAAPTRTACVRWTWQDEAQPQVKMGQPAPCPHMVLMTLSLPAEDR